jgi:hypothetical protein
VAVQLAPYWQAPDQADLMAQPQGFPRMQIWLWHSSTFLLRCGWKNAGFAGYLSWQKAGAQFFLSGFQLRLPENSL